MIYPYFKKSGQYFLYGNKSYPRKEAGANFLLLKMPFIAYNSWQKKQNK
jgi:hypothetical protein